MQKDASIRAQIFGAQLFLIQSSLLGKKSFREYLSLLSVSGIFRNYDLFLCSTSSTGAVEVLIDNVVQNHSDKERFDGHISLVFFISSVLYM